MRRIVKSWSGRIALISVFALAGAFGAGLDAANGGNQAVVLWTGPVAGGIDISFELRMESYPLAPGKEPAYQLIVNPPVTTQRIRLVSRDERAHVTEIRLFEAGMPQYPPVMGGTEEGVDLPNFALGAKVTASSRWAAERHESNVVDGDIGFDSRWVSGGRPPHELVIDIGQPRTIGCLQMVSGYPVGNEWMAAAENFYFEYEEDGVWRPVPGSGRVAGAEPSRIAVVLDGGRHSYRLVHQQEEVNWVVLRTDEGGEERRVGEYSIGMENLREGEIHLLNVVVTPKTVVLILDGRALFGFSHSLGEIVKIGVESLSPAVRFSASVDQQRRIEERSGTVPGRIAFNGPEGDALDFVFNPRQPRQSFALPRRLPFLQIEATPAVAGQTISFNGVSGKVKAIDLSPGSDRTVAMTVQSADGSAETTYKLEFAAVPPSDRFELAFFDEFEGSGLDYSKWHYRVGTRWNSRQRPENVVIRDGRLISVLEVDEDGNQFTGGIISNEAFGYGYYETSARLWKHRGWHSAFWQMQASGVRVNEIDGFESVSPNSFSTNLQHYRPRNILGAREHRFDVAGNFNTFAWEWLPDRVRFYFNGELIRDDPYPGPHLPQHVWLGSVARQDASTADLPGSVEFEYFRYYRLVDSAESPRHAVIVDTGSPGHVETGDWVDAEYAVSHRKDFRTRVSRVPGAEAAWQVELPGGGEYEVLAWNPYIFSDGNHSRMDFFIEHAGGTARSRINPMRDGQRWVSLGKFRFPGDSPAVVRTVVGGTRPHRVDAVKFVPLAGMD